MRLAAILWLLFSAGGTVAALLFPAHLFVTGLAVPLGWLPAPGPAALSGLLAHPLARLYLFLLIALPLFHWARRFRYTLRDGLQLTHMTLAVEIACYGAAAAGTLLAAYLLLTLP